MAYSLNILFNYRSCIQIRCDIVSCCADNFYSARISLIIWFCSRKGGQKRVVNIDDVFGTEGRDELRGYDLHVAGEHHEIALVLAEKGELLPLGFGFVFFCDRNDLVRDAVEVGDPLVVGVVREDERDVAGQLSILMAVQQVLQAVVVFRDKDSKAMALGGAGDAPVHLVVASHRREALGKFGKVERERVEVELDAGEEQIRLLVGVLVVGEYVGVVPEDKVGDGSDDALAVRAGDKKDGRVAHA